MTATARKRKHSKKIEAVVDRTPHVPRIFHVIDCACGWQSPLCGTHERALTLYDEHRKQKVVRQS